jgi:hypothetical protein
LSSLRFISSLSINVDYSPSPYPSSTSRRPSREGNTPLHPSQEGIYSLPWWERAGVRGFL